MPCFSPSFLHTYESTPVAAAPTPMPSEFAHIPHMSLLRVHLTSSQASAPKPALRAAAYNSQTVHQTAASSHLPGKHVLCSHHSAS
mmetsp:Transcript_28736/g.73114  ORF Transcript_28736/g.73114 Transcript_28736/m.73114 type:complete len:86 (+) Transcript_28736:86-343(+)